MKECGKVKKNTATQRGVSGTGSVTAERNGTEPGNNLLRLQRTAVSISLLTHTQIIAVHKNAVGYVPAAAAVAALPLSE